MRGRFRSRRNASHVLRTLVVATSGQKPPPRDWANGKRLVPRWSTCRGSSRHTQSGGPKSAGGLQATLIAKAPGQRATAAVTPETEIAKHFCLPNQRLRLGPIASLA